LRASLPQPAPPPSNVSTISSNFNGTSIAAGDFIWFNSVMKVSGLGSYPTTITVTGASVQFTSNGTAYNISAPDALITFSPSVTSASTTFDAVNNRWRTFVPLSFSQNVFLAGLAYPVSQTIPAGINPVTWTGTFYTDTPGVSLNWQWAAAAYTTFSASENALGAKPVDGNTSNSYANSDHAGTPENFKSSVTGGASGGGGSNWTGSYSGTASVVPSVVVSPPVANAGPAQTVALGATVQLNGTGSTDPDGYALTYQWSLASIPTGSSAALSAANTPTPTFVADKSGSYTAQLIVSDVYSSSSPSIVLISTQPVPPVANAGSNQSVKTGTTVQLDGSKSTDANGLSLTYQWTFVSVPTGSTAVLSNPTIVNPTFVTDLPGNFVLQLIVNDGHNSSSPSQVTITDSYVPPTANAGPNQTVEVNTTVQLDGSHSTDLQGYPLTYSWSILSAPAGSTATLSNPQSVKPTFVPNSLGGYVLQLIVNDGVANSTASTVQISTNDVAPVANPGKAQTVTVGTLVTLDGTLSSDSDNQPLTYSWSMTTKPFGSNASLVSPSSSKPSFQADLPGTYVIQLIVNDGFLNSQPATVMISTNDVAPVANPGPNQNVNVSATVQLDGSGSTDSINKPLSYQWAILNQPTGGSAVLSNAALAKPTFVANVPGIYVAQLIVNDGYLSSQPQTVTITAAQQNQPPVVSAGSNQTIELPVNAVTLQGQIVDPGKPTGSQLNSLWTQTGGPGTVTIANPTQLTTQASFPLAGTYNLLLTVTNATTQQSGSGSVTITVLPVNQAPVVSAGPDQTIQLPTQTVSLAGSATDDGLPPNGGLAYRWSKDAGPGTVTFANPAAAVTTATLSTSGVYFLRLSVSDTQLTGTAVARITLLPAHTAPTVNAGSNQIITLPLNAAILNGSVQTHGLPPGATLTSTWSLVSGPGPVGFANANSPSTTATFTATGTYDLRLTTNDGTFTSSADVTIVVNPASFAEALVMTPNAVGPDVTEGSQTINALLTDSSGAPIPNAVVQFTVSGANTTTGTATTDANGNAQFSYVGYEGGVDTVTATASVGGSLLQSNSSKVNWIRPIQPFSTTPIVGQFFTSLLCEGYFCTPPTATPDFTQNFPTINFDPLPGMVPGNTSGIDDLARPFTNVITDLNGNYSGTIVAQGNGDQAGVGNLFKFQAVFTGSFLIRVPGNYTIRIFNDDGMFFGIGNGATRVSGQQIGTLPTSGLTPFNNYPVMGGYNTGTGAVGFDYVVNFPTVGSYPFELDYAEGFGQGLCLTMALYNGTAAATIPPVTNIALTPNATITGNIGQFASFTVFVQDASGTPLANTNVIFNVIGVNPLQSRVLTDTTGHATFKYTGLNVGSDRVNATAPITGISGYSNEANVTWSIVPNQPPAVTPEPNQTVNLPNAATLSAVVTDDGLPNGTLTSVWTQTSGPAAANILNPNATTTQVTFPQTGLYVFTITASDSALTTSGNVGVTVNAQVNQAPVVSAGPAQSIRLPQNTLVLIGTATDDGLPNGTLAIQWSTVSGPGTVVFSSPNSAATQATFSAAGTYVLQLSANDSALTTNATVTIIVLAPLGPPPSVSLTLVDGAQITQPTPIVGSVSNGAWQLTYTLQDDFHPQSPVVFAMGSGAVSNGTLGTFDPTLLFNGTYQIQLTSTDSGGQFTNVSTTVDVTRNMKVGVFTLSFNDLSVPVAGLPIQVVRTYDSRDKGVGDFGVGWRLSLSNARLQKNHPIGQSWQETVTVSSGFPQYCLQPTSNTVVTVTLPDGKVYSFQPVSSPQCQLDAPITDPTITYTQIQGAAGTNGATLVSTDGGAAVVNGDLPGAVSLSGFDGNTYNPTIFKLTTAQGQSFVIDQQLGITSLTDTNGNTLTFTANGIQSSAGKGIAFARDSQGRIDRITDPNGNALVYVYNGNGDLVGFADRQNNLTNFAYGDNHYLQSITTPDGKTVLTNTYDSSGRLISTADAFSNLVGFTHDVPNRTETVTDRLGNATVYNYDANGNVIQVTDPLGNVTTSTYDADDNKLTQTNALGKTTRYTYDNLDNRLTEADPLGNKTSYSYNSFQQVLTVTDPLNHNTTNTYDGNGNLLSTTDPLGKTTTNTYSNSGLLLTTLDPLNHTTLFGYDGSGNLLTQTDAAGTVTTYTYDSDGNRLTQAVTRTTPSGPQTLTTTYTYDANNRLVKTTAPDGAVSQTVYNALGQQAATIDARGNRTAYQYDGDGHVIQTTYADGTSDSAQYDAEGHRTQSTNRGIVTNYVYDKDARLSQTIAAADSATTTTNYDAAGQVISTKDPLNNLTQYAYDDAGRRTSVTDALTHVTTFAYDAAGNQTSVKDANQNTTTYTYDAANRRTQVTYPDQKFDSTAYDALGRVVTRTDANGNATAYGYDALGRLTSVTDALGQITKYTYDEVGNRLTQTDANTHTTSYVYDQRGRRVQRTLPLGQTESYTYDANGNLATRTDFNGRTTTYAYDTMNRLLSKTADAYFAQNHLGAAGVSYTYTATGKRKTMNDASGSTTYQYDQRDRLSAKNTPEGTVGYDRYDLASNLTQLTARANGPSFAAYYGYDALNRLVEAYRGNLNVFSTLSYDAVGNLATVNYPNGVVHSYTYDTRNRLTNLGVAANSANVFGYTYTLDAAGHRTGVTELSGRTVSYGYDSIYRLTNETIASDPNAVNGAVSYTYDPVGNRTQKTSTLPGFPGGGLTNYNANDQLATDTYDAVGNTTASNGVGYAYDFENHLVQAGGGISYVYDGDGTRVSKTVAGVTTTYLVADDNPTGYAQVLEEDDSTGGIRQYIYGLNLISRLDVSSGQSIYYVYDGHGSVRALTNSTGAVTDTYDYDAFGVLLHKTGMTSNNYLFAGEQFDPDLGLYYNRARYLNVSTGRFWNMDTLEGDDEDPSTLHKYLFTANDPTDRLDRSGNDFDLVSLGVATAIGVVISVIPTPLAQEYRQGGSAEPRVATTQSERGEEFLKCHEGINCEALLVPYDHDGSKAGNCTIGWGHKIHDGVCTDQDHDNYVSYSESAAEQQLFLDVQQKALAPIRRSVQVVLAQRELDALIDFTFNVGGGSKTNHQHPGLAGSLLLVSLNAHNYKQAGNGFLGFKAGGTGIIRRRNDEKNLWDTGVYSSYDHSIQ
jgi:RHS repeat-associated protein